MAVKAKNDDSTNDHQDSAGYIQPISPIKPLLLVTTFLPLTAAFS